MRRPDFDLQYSDLSRLFFTLLPLATEKKLGIRRDLADKYTSH